MKHWNWYTIEKEQVKQALSMDYKEEQNGEIEALLSIYENEIDSEYPMPGMIERCCLMSTSCFDSSSDRAPSCVHHAC